VVCMAECLTAGRTLPRSVGDKILYTALTEGMTAQFEDGVAQIRVTNRTNGDFLLVVSL
jgi:hypothetical protein